VEAAFVQDNHSRSIRNVLRGIHYQVVRPQGKLVRVVSGRIFDVAVDLRRSSKTFSRWIGVELSADNHRQLWVPPGFGHAFLALSDSADVLYKTTEYWIGEHDRAVLWSDPALGIEWPLTGAPIVSGKDAAAPPLERSELFD
jgi:dTDP-4-dehydrorhamnose 3,5-epimerase